VNGLDDDALLSALGAALRGPPAAPSELEEGELRRQLAQARSASSSGRGSQGRHGRSALAVALAAGSLVLGGGAVAAASGASLPPALRGPVRSLGIPVESTALSSARETMAEVRRALAGSDTQALKKDVPELRHCLDHLSATDRRRVEPAAAALLTEGDDRLDSLGSDGKGSSATTEDGGSGPSSGSGSGAGAERPSSVGTGDHGGRSPSGPSVVTSGESGNGDGHQSTTLNPTAPSGPAPAVHGRGDDSGGQGSSGANGAGAAPATTVVPSGGHSDGGSSGDTTTTPANNGGADDSSSSN
jgi:hypothetical protein